MPDESFWRHFDPVLFAHGCRMQFKEIVVQGLFGVAKGLRLPLAEGLCEPLLPPPLDAEKFKDIVTLIMYPYDALRLNAVPVDLSVPHSVRLGALIEIDGKDHKVVWDLKEDTMQVVADPDGARNTIASSRQEAQQAWERLLGLLPLELFRPLHMHEFPEASGQPGVRDEKSKLTHEYRRAVTIEKLELDIESINAKLREYASAKTPANKIEAALDKINTRLRDYDKLPELSESQREFLTSYETNHKQRTVELNECNAGLADTQRRRGQLDLTPIFANKLFWLGAIVGVVCSVAAYVLSIADPKMRGLAFGNVLGFGLATFVMLRNLGANEKNAIYETRIRHLDDRRRELEKSIERDGIRLKKIGQAFGSKQADQILVDVDHRNELLDKRSKLEAKLRTHLLDPVFIKQREEIEALRERQTQLKAKRATFGDFVLPTHELRPALEKLGVAVDGLKGLEEAPETPVLEASRRLGILNKDTKFASSAELDDLNKLVPPIIGTKQAVLSLDDGQLMFSAEGEAVAPLRDRDDRTQRPWLRAAAMSLLLAHNKQRKRVGEHASFIVIADPWQGLDRNERVRFFGLLKEYAKAFQVILPKSGD